MTRQDMRRPLISPSPRILNYIAEPHPILTLNVVCVIGLDEIRKQFVPEESWTSDTDKNLSLSVAWFCFQSACSSVSLETLISGSVFDKRCDRNMHTDEMNGEGFHSSVVVSSARRIAGEKFCHSTETPAREAPGTVIAMLVSKSLSRQRQSSH